MARFPTTTTNWRGTWQKFKDSKTAVKRIWARIQRLGESVAPKSESPAKSPAQRKAKRGAQAAQSAPARGRSGKKATPAKHAPKGKKAAQGREAGTPRAGTKTAQVVAMLQAQGRGDPGRDHGEDGLAAAHRPRVYGRRHEEGRLLRRVLQAGGRGPHVSHQPIAVSPLFARPAPAVAGFLACGDVNENLSAVSPQSLRPSLSEATRSRNVQHGSQPKGDGC